MNDFLPVDVHTRSIVICFNGHSEDLDSSHFEQITKTVFGLAKNMSEFVFNISESFRLSY